MGDPFRPVSAYFNSAIVPQASPLYVRHIPVHEPFTTSHNIPCIGQRQLPASVARSHAVLALARGYSLTDRIAPGDTARLRVGVLTGH